MSQLLEALSKVIDPELRRPITELGMVEKAEIVGNKAIVKVLLTISGCPMRDRLNQDIHSALRTISEVKEIEIGRAHV